MTGVIVSFSACKRKMMPGNWSCPSLYLPGSLKKKLIFTNSSRKNSKKPGNHRPFGKNCCTIYPSYCCTVTGLCRQFVDHQYRPEWHPFHTIPVKWKCYETGR